MQKLPVPDTVLHEAPVTPSPQDSMPGVHPRAQYLSPVEIYKEHSGVAHENPLGTLVEHVPSEKHGGEQKSPA